MRKMGRAQEGGCLFCEPSCQPLCCPEVLLDWGRQTLQGTVKVSMKAAWGAQEKLQDLTPPERAWLWGLATPPSADLRTWSGPGAYSKILEGREPQKE